MILCEVCGMMDGMRRPATMCCAGLDVPMLHFCTLHGQAHAKRCDSIKAGKAQCVVMGEVHRTLHRTCACVSVDAVRCLQLRYDKDHLYGETLDQDERCECYCHDEDHEEDHGDKV